MMMVDNCIAIMVHLLVSQLHSTKFIHQHLTMLNRYHTFINLTPAKQINHKSDKFTLLAVAQCPHFPLACGCFGEKRIAADAELAG